MGGKWWPNWVFAFLIAVTEVNASLAKICCYQEKDMDMLSLWESLVHQLIMNTYIEKESVADRAGHRSDTLLLVMYWKLYRVGIFKKAHIVCLICSCNTLKQGVCLVDSKYVECTAGYHQLHGIVRFLIAVT